MTTVPATSSKKRSRSNGASASPTPSASGRQVTAPSAPNALPPRLEPLRAMLESQPDELKGIIISHASEMLVLRSDIKEKEMSLLEFDAPQTDPSTGSVLKDSSGNNLPFIPRSVRLKCPIAPSKPMVNEPAMIAVVEAASAAHEAHVRVLAEYAKQIAELEISLRRNQLRYMVFDLLKKIALAHDVANIVKTGLPSGVGLNQEQRVSMSVTQALMANTIPAIAVSLGVETNTKLVEDFGAQQPARVPFGLYTGAAVNFLKPTIELITRWLPSLTLHLFASEDKKAQERAINAAIRRTFKPAAIQKATELVDLTMTDATTATSSLVDTIRHISKQCSKKERKIVQRELRKNFLGDAKASALKPTSSGAKSKKSSAGRKAASRPPQNSESANKSAAASPPPAQEKKKKKKRGKRGKKSRDSQGASNVGGNNVAPARR